MLVCVTSVDGSGRLFVEFVSTEDKIRGLVRYRHFHVWTDRDAVMAAVKKMNEYGVDLAHVEKSEYWSLVVA